MPTFNGFGARKAPTGEIKGWVRHEMGLDEDAVVTVSELECAEPGCPPIETAISVFRKGQEPFGIKVPKPVAELERSHITAALAGEHQH
ncbi:MAG: nitrate reductase [Acidimicrobiales bacterium]